MVRQTCARVGDHQTLLTIVRRPESGIRCQTPGTKLRGACLERGASTRLEFRRVLFDLGCVYSTLVLLPLETLQIAA